MEDFEDDDEDEDVDVGVWDARVEFVALIAVAVGGRSIISTSESLSEDKSSGTGAFALALSPSNFSAEQGFIEEDEVAVPATDVLVRLALTFEAPSVRPEEDPTDTGVLG